MELDPSKNYMVTKNLTFMTVVGLVYYACKQARPFKFVGDDGRTHAYQTMEEAVRYGDSIVEVSGQDAHAWKMKYRRNQEHGGYKGRVMDDGSFVSVKQAERGLGVELVREIHDLVNH
jgi:hypothetical protein